MDGAIGYTQCPIPPGRHFIYNFTISDEEHGTFWWHSHFGAQRADGLYGGFVVRQPRRQPLTLEKEALLMVGDWFHDNQTDELTHFHSRYSQGIERAPDSVVINGYGNYNCSKVNPFAANECKQHMAETQLPLLRQHLDTRLRIVNAGSIAGLTTAVENSSLRLLGVDGGCRVNAEPKKSIGIIYPGQRIDVLFAWNMSAASDRLNIYLDLRYAIAESFPSGQANLIDFSTFLHRNPFSSPYQTFGITKGTLLTTKAEMVAPQSSSNSVAHLDLASISAASNTPTLDLDQEVETIILSIWIGQDQFSGQTLGSLNGISWKPQYPPLLALNRSSWDEDQDVYFIGTNRTSKLVKILINNAHGDPHTFHLHGHSFYAVASYRSPGRAEFPGTHDPKHPENGKLGALAGPGGWTNYKNPVRRDTVTVPRWGHTLISFVADNPGLWLLHCHMLLHQGVGMAAGLQVGDLSDRSHEMSQNSAAGDLCIIN